MSGTQFLSILPECSGAPRSKTRISFLYYIGSFAMWRGVEYGLVHAISACTGRVRRQFENCGYRRQYSKSACAPLCRRSGLSERSTEQGPLPGIKELSAKQESGEALSMEASQEFSRTPRRLPPCSDVSVL